MPRHGCEEEDKDTAFKFGWVEPLPKQNQKKITNNGTWDQLYYFSDAERCACVLHQRVFRFVRSSQLKEYFSWLHVSLVILYITTIICKDDMVILILGTIKTVSCGSRIIQHYC